jgi:hypothetical protein
LKLLGNVDVQIGGAVTKPVDLQPEQEFVDLTFKVVHPDIDPAQVGLLMSGQKPTRLKVEADEVTFRLDATSLKTDTLLRLIPTVDRKEQRPIQLRITRKGVVRLVTENVFGRWNEGGQFYFRVFLTGEHKCGSTRRDGGFTCGRWQADESGHQNTNARQVCTDGVPCGHETRV